jgi:hypothetical protein
MVASTRTAHSAVGVGVEVGETVADAVAVVVAVTVGVGLELVCAHEERSTSAMRRKGNRFKSSSIGGMGPGEDNARAHRRLASA